MVPTWVGPTIAIALVVIAVSLLVMGGVVLAIGLGLRRARRRLGTQLTAFTDEARVLASRLKHELDGFADLSTDARQRLKGAMDTVDGRLRDLDALVEVLQQEAEEAALDVAALVRTVRSSGRILGAARRQMLTRRGPKS
jgi:hypothetical protein